MARAWVWRLLGGGVVRSAVGFVGVIGLGEKWRGTWECFPRDPDSDRRRTQAAPSDGCKGRSGPEGAYKAHLVLFEQK